MASLDTPITALPGIGEKKAAAFRKLGIETYGDMLSHFPRRYDDRSNIVPIAMAIPEDTCCVQAMVTTPPKHSRIRRGMELVKFRIADDTGVIDVTYFNQPYIKNALHVGETYNFYGKITAVGSRKQMSNPVYEKADQPRVTGRIIPVYRSTPLLSQKVMVAATEICLNDCGHLVPDLLPEDVTRRNNLCQAEYAYRNIHFPESMLSLSIARQRMVFEELFVLACAIKLLHGSKTPVEGLKLNKCNLDTFYTTLPFTPTGAQKRAIDAAVSDMTSGLNMNRLVQGDVGSGKTLVAAGCIWAAAQSGKVSAMMAPTEILAEQHLRTMRKFLEPCGLRIGLLTGSMTAKQKRTVKAEIVNGAYDLVIGTHAVITGDVEIPNLALVIVDEQHRFGVEQRAALAKKGETPHVLVMSATPIPRTLALIIYGDLDVSIIDELPPGRQKIDTLLVNESYRQRLNGFIRKQITDGRQVFVICPKVEEDEEETESNLDLKSAEEHAKYMQEEFPDLRVGCVHGRLKEKQKDSVMSAFVAGEIDILVATTVVEVGVDIPNANLMVIENAERFGLSQLHQLRGRIGRGEHKSWCVLVSDSTNEVSRQRLKIMTKTSDGFVISEEDLRLRGPGDFFGNRQHGLPETHIADLGADMNVLVAAQEEANALMERDPALIHYPKLKQHVLKMVEKAGSTFN